MKGATATRGASFRSIVIVLRYIRGLEATKVVSRWIQQAGTDHLVA